MKLVRVVDFDRIQPLHVILVCLVAVTVAGSCLLTSGPHARMEGSRDWQEESPLRAIVHVLNLNYTQTTAQGIEIKAMVFGIGASLAAIALGVGLLLRPTAGDEVSPDDTTVEASRAEAPSARVARRQMGPLTAAQLLMVAYVIWSFLSANPKWSGAPDLALGGSVLLAVGVVWALALGRGLNRPTATAGAGLLLGVCAVTAVIAIVYFGERNPTRRASYPIGNPLFLAACLIPGALLSAGFLIASVRSIARRPAGVITALLCFVAGAAILWTIHLTSARASALALGLGLAVMVFLAVPRRFRWPVALVLAVTSIVGLGLLWPRFTAPSDTGRDATLRLRHYAWWYAIDMIEETPIIGQGQGAYTQFGDASAAQDVLQDPQALESRIAHAHNEWLEVGADLGAVGLTLVLGSLAMTLWAGTAALPGVPSPVWRWALIGLLASLAAMIVEESADVALRIAGFPTVFYTVLGLVWALSRSASADSTGVFRRGRGIRVGGGVGALIVGVALLWASLADFQSARAYHDTSIALQNRNFDRAVRLAGRAVSGRLNPERRLEAFERLCSTHLYIARAHQTVSMDRYTRAAQVNPPDARLLQLAVDDRASAEKHIELARKALESLVRRSPTYFGAGWLEYRLNQLLNVYARSDGDTSLASRATTAAALALERELARSPYDPLIAVSFIEIARERMDLEQVLDVLARPLRREPTPMDYAEFMARTSREEGFDASFNAIWKRITRDDADAVLNDDPLAPEKLRLAALIRFTGQDYARALDTARMAGALYERLSVDAAMGAAGCWMETAEYQFFADPTQWRGAIGYAERALAVLPDSTPGRNLAAQLRGRMVLYNLAGEEEQSARHLLVELLPGSGTAFLDAELGRYYTVLCRSFIHESRAGLPVGFARWVTRALDLRPRDELAWRLNAQVALGEDRFDDSVTSLRRALEFGADPGTVYTFVQLALREHPDQPGFRAFYGEMSGGVPEDGVPTTEPAPARFPNE